MAWLPAESFREAGALPRNFSSTKISAPSGSEEIVTVPTPSGAAGAEAFKGWTASLVSAAEFALATDAVLCLAGATLG